LHLHLSTHQPVPLNIVSITQLHTAWHMLDSHFSDTEPGAKYFLTQCVGK